MGIAPHQKVVVFLGTPREHKGLLDVALALQSLARDDLVFVAEGGYLQVRIQRYFASTEATLIERFSFGDGVNWTAADIAARLAL